MGILKKNLIKKKCIFVDNQLWQCCQKPINRIGQVPSHISLIAMFLRNFNFCSFGIKID